jgi:YggT family protein
MIRYVLNLLLTTYTFMLMARVIGSWFPKIALSHAMRFLAFYTDPYLNLFRKVIPPLGIIDLSPMVAFMTLQIFQFLIKILF